MRSVMRLFFAWGLGLTFVLLVAGASAQSPVIEIDAESGLPTASDIHGELAARIAEEVNLELETSSISALEEAKSRRPSRAPNRETLGFYGVQIDVRRDGSLEVTETIDAYALGQQINRGIYREFSLLNVERYHHRIPTMLFL